MRIFEKSKCGGAAPACTRASPTRAGNARPLGESKSFVRHVIADVESGRRGLADARDGLLQRARGGEATAISRRGERSWPAHG